MGFFKHHLLWKYCLALLLLSCVTKKGVYIHEATMEEGVEGKREEPPHLCRIEEHPLLPTHDCVVATVMLRGACQHKKGTSNIRLIV